MIRGGFSVQLSETPPLPKRNTMQETNWAAELYTSDNTFNGTRAEQTAQLTRHSCTDTHLKWQMDRQRGLWKALKEGSS